MRKVTATEKYRAVNEGQLSKANFLKDMQIAYPQVISQLNGYDTSVQILKNRGYIHEKSSIDSYDSRTDLNISPDSIDRGIRYEMQARGKEASDCKDIVMKNLKKDPLHYIMLVAKDSSKVNKHDKEVEVKRGANDVDTFNGLKKADLKENKKELSKLLKEGKMSDLAEKLGVDVSRLQDAADRLREMEREEAANSADKVEAMKAVIEEEPDEVMNIDRFGKEKEDHDSNYTKVKEEEVVEIEGAMIDEHEYEFFSIIFDKKYDDILEDYMSSDSFKQDEKELQAEKGQANVFDYAYKDQWENYIREFESINRDDLGENEAEVQREMASSNLELKSLAKKLFLRFKNMGANVELTTDKVTLDKAPRGDSDLKNVWIQVNDDGISLSLVGDKAISFNDKIQNDFSNFEFIQRQDSKTWNGQDVKNLTILPGKDMSEKKGKDHDGDGDIDGDDYMAAKDKAIKKATGKDEQLKEAIKKIIKSSLLNEAATAKLSDIGDKYGDYKGMQVVINDLENIVTDMEGYFAKVRERVQSSMDKIGQIETPDGMKVGAFLAPAIESAFFRDLNPVRKLSARDISLPQVKTISSADIAAARAAGDIEEQPKQTMFGVNETKL